MNKRKNQKGFTIIELMIALVILSFILLVSTAVFIALGNLFKKGQTETSTQNIALNVENNVTGDIKLNQQILSATSNCLGDLCGASYSVSSGSSTVQAIVYAYCIGTYRYSFVLDREQISTSSGLVAGQHQTYHALYLDQISPGQACVPLNLLASNPESGSMSGINGSGQDLLPNSMRVLEFSINNTSNPLLYSIDLSLAYGDNDLLNISPSYNSSSLGPNQYTGSCIDQAGQRFCDVVNFSTAVTIR